MGVDKEIFSNGKWGARVFSKIKNGGGGKKLINGMVEKTSPLLDVFNSKGNWGAKTFFREIFRIFCNILVRFLIYM